MQYATATVGAFDGHQCYIFWPADDDDPLQGGEYIWSASSTATVDLVNYSVIQISGVSTGRWLRLYDRVLRDGIHEPLVALGSEVSGVLPLTQQWSIVRKFDIEWGGFSNSPYSHCTVMQTGTIPVLLEGETDTYAYKKFTKLVIQGFSGASNGVLLTGGTIPLAYRPVRDASVAGVALIGTDLVPCVVGIYTATGTLIVFPLADGKYGGAFPATGTKGIYGDFTFFYETTV